MYSLQYVTIFQWFAGALLHRTFSTCFIWDRGKHCWAEVRMCSGRLHSNAYYNWGLSVLASAAHWSRKPDDHLIFGSRPGISLEPVQSSIMAVGGGGRWCWQSTDCWAGTGTALKLVQDWYGGLLGWTISWLSVPVPALCQSWLKTCVM